MILNNRTRTEEALPEHRQYLLLCIGFSELLQLVLLAGLVTFQHTHLVVVLLLQLSVDGNEHG